MSILVPDYTTVRQPIPTMTLVYEKAVWTAEIDAVAGLHVLEVLRHLSAVWKLWMDSFEVNLQSRSSSTELRKVQSKRSLIILREWTICRMLVTGD